jgi:hypothetical protein
VVRQSLKGPLEFESIGDFAARSRAICRNGVSSAISPSSDQCSKRVEGDDAAWVAELLSNEIDEARNRFAYPRLGKTCQPSKRPILKLRYAAAMTNIAANKQP